MDNLESLANVPSGSMPHESGDAVGQDYSSVMNGSESTIVRLNIKLLQNSIVYRDNNPEMWNQIQKYRDIIERDMNRFGATLVINEKDGHPHAYVTNIPVAPEDGNKLPKLFPMRSLSLRRSWIATYLRKTYMEYEKSSQAKCFMNFDDLFTAFRVCWKTDKYDEVAARKQLQSDLNFFEATCRILAKSAYEPGKYQILPGIKVVCRMQDFTDFDAKLQEYCKRMNIDADENADKEDSGVAE